MENKFICKIRDVKNTCPYIPILDIIMGRKISTFGHIAHHDLLANNILHGSIEGK